MIKLIVMVLLTVMLAMSCMPASTTSEATPNRPPAAFIDSISPSEIIYGEKVSFTGHGTDIDGTVMAYKWRSSIDGDLSDRASVSILSLSVGKHIIFFKVQDNNSVWSAEVQKTLTVVAAAVSAPVIDYFQATPSRISLGSSSMLSWYVSGATTVYVDSGIGNVAPTGNLKVYPPLSTQYTLTATNEGSSISSQQITVLVVPAKTGLPVINSFAAAPGNITAGKPAALNWNVSNAEYIKIEPGVGDVDPVGSASISPAKTTAYTLTAYNNVGIVLSTIQVMVTTAPTSGNPDLVITNVSKVETANGVSIVYTVENRGTNDAPPSTTNLYANGVFKASDYLGMVPAGGSVIRQVSGWLYNPATNIIKVVLDADNNIVESDKSNNTRLVAFPVRTVFDFVDNARNAVWGVGYPYKSLVYANPPEERDGFVSYQAGKKMEDTSVPGKLLEMRPYSIYNGWIMGDYNIGLQVMPGDTFYGLVGLLDGAFAGGVEFWVFIRSPDEPDWTVLVPGVEDIYDYRLKAIAISIPPRYFGKNVALSLQVHANGEPLQSWAAWVEAKIIR